MPINQPSENQGLKAGEVRANPDAVKSQASPGLVTSANMEKTEVEVKQKEDPERKKHPNLYDSVKGTRYRSRTSSEELVEVKDFAVLKNQRGDLRIVDRAALEDAYEVVENPTKVSLETTLPLSEVAQTIKRTVPATEVKKEEPK